MPTAETIPARRLPTIWGLPDELWQRIEPILAKHYPPASTGRPRADLRLMLDAIIYRMRSGVQWNQLPAGFGPDSTVHHWFQRFVADGVLREIWAELVRECDALGAVGWEWQAADGVMGKSRFEGGARGPNPTDSERPSTYFNRRISAHSSTPSNAFPWSRPHGSSQITGPAGRPPTPRRGGPLFNRRRRTSIRAATVAPSSHVRRPTVCLQARSW